MTSPCKVPHLSGWGGYPQFTCNRSYLSETLNRMDQLSGASSFTPRGMGRSYGDVALSLEEGVILDTQYQNFFLNLDEEQGLLEAAPGVSLEEILDVLIPRGWFLPVVPGTRKVSLGGAIASNVHGKNHHHTGAMGNFVESLDVLTEKGYLHCSPQENKDLFQATIGGFGMTGLIQSIRLRLKRIESTQIAARLIQVRNLEEAMGRLREMDEHYEYSVVWMDTLARGKRLGRGIVMVGNHESVETGRGKPEGLHNKWKSAITCPPNVPGCMLSPLMIYLFNQLYYHRLPRRENERLLNFESWFFPLDAIHQWNRMYGHRGFVQYQFVLPLDGAYPGIRKILNFLAQHKMGSFLSVLKRVREDSISLPFAIPGFTLALDIPLRHDSVFQLLDELDSMVLEYGGRLYLAKDARMKASTFRQMYPEHVSWLETVRQYAPRGLFTSRMGERLEWNPKPS